MTTAEQKSKRATSRRSRIPEFKNVQEEAEFWDTHDSADYEDEFEGLVDLLELVTVMAQTKRPMTIRLEPDVIKLLTQEARSQGVGASTLARMAVLKYLKDCGRGTMVRRESPKGKRSKGVA